MNATIVGGAGFIGANTAHSLMERGWKVTVLDDLSRAGSEKNLEWLQELHPQLEFTQVDIRRFKLLRESLAAAPVADVIFHFAAQVAVTSSVEDPRTDFEVNALGTLNLLEAVRELRMDPVLLYTSTNKVYGALSSLRVHEAESRYAFADLPLGVPETLQLDFYSPYGCSKGAADQYFRDYHRMYGLRTIVFRNSCIYGPRQFGVEDQGWLAWMMIAAVYGKQISIYGDGKQVRDVLFIDDLVEAMLAAVERADVTSGRIYNIGGGPENSLSIWREFGPMLSDLLGIEIPVAHGDWRPGDQRVYISDISRAAQDFDWKPRTGPEAGLERLHDWVRSRPVELALS